MAVAIYIVVDGGVPVKVTSNDPTQCGWTEQEGRVIEKVQPSGRCRCATCQAIRRILNMPYAR